MLENGWNRCFMYALKQKKQHISPHPYKWLCLSFWLSLASKFLCSCCFYHPCAQFVFHLLFRILSFVSLFVSCLIFPNRNICNHYFCPETLTHLNQFSGALFVFVRRRAAVLCRKKKTHTAKGKKRNKNVDHRLKTSKGGDIERKKSPLQA